MSALKLKRPIAFFDIEATGISPRADRIVELSIVRLMPDGSRDTHTFRINPEITIPEEVTNIHGISNEDVADCPTFPQVAQEIADLIEGCDLAGYNITRFDIPMLTEEFIRAGITIDPDKFAVVDVQRIFHQREPRDLTAAVRFYANEELEGAHGAEADTLATIKVLEGQFRMYDDLPDTVEALADYCSPRKPDWVDRNGRLKWLNGEVALNFGRKKGTLLRTIIEDDSNFVKWLLRSDFPSDTRDIVEKAQQGIWPKPPSR